MSALTAQGGAVRRRLVSTGVSHYLLWAAALVLLIGPIVPVVVASLWSTPLYQGGGHLTIANYRDLLSDPAWWTAVRNSVVFGALNTVGSVAIGVACAVLFTRTDVPGRRVFGVLLLLPVMLPGIVLILGWSLMWAPSGFASSWLDLHTFLKMPIDLYSVPGMALVGISVAAPVVYLFCRSAIEGIDPSFEDAARTTGASPVRAVLSISVPLLRPAVLNSSLLVFALSIEVLGLPLVLGFSKNIDMISTYLYDNWSASSTPRQGLVSAGAVVLLALVSLLLVARNRLAGDLSRFTTVTGKPTAGRTVKLGPARWAVSAVIAVGLVAMVLVPLFGVVLCAFTTIFTPLVNPWSVLTTANFSAVFDNEIYTRALTNSLLIATVGGALTTLVIAALSMVAHRSEFRFRGSLQRGMVWPRMMPGLITGMAFFWSFAVLDPSGWVRSSLWGMGIAFAVRSLALGYSAFYPALAAIGRDLDNAARTSGATWWQAMRTVVLRLVLPAMAASFVLLFVSMLNDAEPAVFLVTDKTPVLGLTMLQLAATSTGGTVAAFGVIQMIITLVVLGAGRALFGVKPRG
ncbi:ABC transporter permease [Actinomadura madurae]|uniref:ABC transporter permease n=1 Tax=Actinomadura madurae TaxID=1993 RepID=UPI002025BDAA|nr:iron ABC transporter permease [Actinomadura madurae]MCP9964960.1 iron ABC transporter permease [Actinomadura madurae]MCP9977451.1 iron ABC transporter permease [Actinomadura madurae]MCQ0011046.1 iron ABC transporter permease [Actinomadura madurae]URM93854.1 iron ABC transporter permease [Actinomadura madurae]URN04576.1 iron ABC transporter permease [Actinomadura madurae]